MSFYTDVIQKDPRFHASKAIRDMLLLEPITRAAVIALLADAHAGGLNLMVIETYRSSELQQIYYKNGVTRLRTVGVHHYGLAADIVKNVNGEPSWKGDFSFLGPLAKKHGLIWGGDWPHFKDMDHVQRCSLDDEDKLFEESWYPDGDYDPRSGRSNG